MTTKELAEVLGTTHNVVTENGNFTGQQPVYHPNVLDKIREILE